MSRPVPHDPSVPAEAPRDCPVCPRLVEYREDNKRRDPPWFNGAVPSWGDPKGGLAWPTCSDRIMSWSCGGRSRTFTWSLSTISAPDSSPTSGRPMSEAVVPKPVM